MFQSKSFNSTALWLLAFLFTFSTAAFAQGYCHWDGWDYGSDMSWWNHGVPANYALSSDQIKKVNEIRKEYDEKLLPLRNELRTLRMESRGYASPYDADMDKVKTYRKKQRELEAEIEDLRLEMRKEINELLTDKQRLYFNEGNYGWWNRENSWWHENDYGMYGMSDYMDDCCW
ncbi:MAG TPA: hypothetical protein ENK44_13640 [Caldithrix abyssi]|uniref:Periplasmic heavy metal sensor n=1 Tax=Caldithrix abyssi TaxID=187145 RepID=A0A7V4U303_CALAY|nr:hypothetical protein [Caldithrix abyssi]